MRKFLIWSNKWYMHKLVSVHAQLLRDFEIQTDPLISARQPDQVIVNKKKKSCRIGNFTVPAGHKVKIKESEKRDKYLDLAREQKTMEHESDGDTNRCWCTWYNPLRIGNGTGWLGNKRTSQDHPNYSIIKIGQNTEKSPRKFRRPDATQTPARSYQLTLVWKTFKRVKW